MACAAPYCVHFELQHYRTCMVYVLPSSGLHITDYWRVAVIGGCSPLIVVLLKSTVAWCAWRFHVMHLSVIIYQTRGVWLLLPPTPSPPLSPSTQHTTHANSNNIHLHQQHPQYPQQTHQTQHHHHNAHRINLNITTITTSASPSRPRRTITTATAFTVFGS